MTEGRFFGALDKNIYPLSGSAEEAVNEEQKITLSKMELHILDK